MIKVVTHNGNFHADEVFAIATVILALPEGEEVEIIRTRDNEIISDADYAVDVGLEHNPQNKRFDHHQPGGAGIRGNGIPYASFGLVWNEYGERLSGSKEVADVIENKLVLFIDALDNGIEVSKSVTEGIRDYTISDYLYSYWVDDTTEPIEIDRVFKRVVSLAKNLIKREVKKAQNIKEQEVEVEEIYKNSSDKKVIIMDKHLAWGNLLVEKPEPLFAVYPSPGGFWYAKAIAKKKNSFELRMPFPDSWSGKSDGELVRLSGVADAVFCHKGLFLAVAKTKEGALALARKALEG